MQAPPTPTLLLQTRRVVYLLTLRWGGVVYRLSTEPVSLYEPDLGITVQYQGGLTDLPDVPTQFDRQGGDDGGASVPMAIYLDGTDIAERIAQGWRLDSARAELCELPIGWDGALLGEGEADTWRRRTIHIHSGRLLLPVLAGADTPASALSFTLEETLYDSTAPLLDPDAVIDERSWSQASRDLDGKPYPVVIGKPGLFRKADGSDGSTSGSPAYVVEHTSPNADTLLICDGWVSASTVTIYDEDGDSHVCDVVLTTDGRGRPCSVADVTSASGIDRHHTNFYVGWTNGAGLLNPSGTAPLRTLGDVCRWALSRLGQRIDTAAWAARSSGPLASVLVDTYLNDPEMTPLDLVEELLSPFPTVTVQAGPDGLYPHVRLLDAPDDDSVMLITEAGDFSPTGPLETQTEPGDIRNAYTVRFAPRANGGTLKRYVTCTPQRDPSDAAQFSSAYALMSASRYGRSAAETLEVSWIYDESSAALIAALQVRVNGFPYSTRSYRADWRYGWLEVGQRVRLTSSSLHLSGVLVEVVGKAPRIGGYEFLLAFDDDPVRLGSKRAV